MAKLINAEELLRAMKKADEADPDLSTCWSRGSIRRIIEGVPAVDAVEVVRCKDCKHSDHSRCGIDGVLYCMKHSRFMVDDDFCSYGGRRRSDG